MPVGLTRDLTTHLQGFLWGSDPSPLLSLLPPDSKGYDILILTDLIFNHSQHHQLVSSCLSLLSPTGSILLTFSSHVPKKRDKDLAFFPLCEEAGLEIKEHFEEKMEPMFGDEAYVGVTEEERVVRGTVGCYILGRKGR